VGEVEKRETGEDISGGREVVARSQKGHAIYGFDGPKNDRPIFGFDPVKDHPICASPKRKGSGCCRSVSRHGNGQCAKHGGEALRGPASPKFKDGEHSIYTPPPSLLADYYRLADHPELIQHRTSVKLNDALIKTSLRAGPSGSRRARERRGGGWAAWPP